MIVLRVCDPVQQPTTDVLMVLLYFNLSVSGLEGRNDATVSRRSHDYWSELAQRTDPKWACAFGTSDYLDWAHGRQRYCSLRSPGVAPSCDHPLGAGWL